MYKIFLTTLTVIFLTVSCIAIAADNQDLYIGNFSKGKLDNWEVKEFSGKTDYKIVNDRKDSKKRVLKAISNSTASGLFMEKRIDLQKTPYLHWSWRTEKLYSNLDESKKQGDDFVARIYLIIDGGLFFWKTRALNYVWSSSFTQGEAWPNPFTANATMFAVESGTKNLGKWLHYSRNVREDLKKFVGKEVRYIDGIALMTDSDNAGQQATTYYGDIYFSPNP
ncbi:conserved hypothetical protein [Psychromonas ingrahamii 37]|uniref:DUF3047 domain-containing protein n=1 Tax=Psychromonas ingrahamii (strain DSM 17664 / CCUG 51855 / 37) TaxID=357804 RepID=A1SVY7_PSYIN|nr:DUF3047 domain-containing protein [Psychromonas ingrahamii]ABM03652.1 conserved hypothetical protein [Psychromonas ingrahamii 37]